MMFLHLFFFGCLGIYVISMIEIIGSYCLTKSVKGYCSDADLIFCILIPPIAPFFAIASIAFAEEYYHKKKNDWFQENESLFCYIRHGFKAHK